MLEFEEYVQHELAVPLKELCDLLAKEEARDEQMFFSGILNMLSDPADEAMILAAVIELSRCAFLGFTYSFEASARIDSILERAINLSHTMSASDIN